MREVNFKIKIIITIVLTFLFVDFCFSQNVNSKNPVLPSNYYKINKKQKNIAKFYLVTRFYYPFGKIRSYNKMYHLTPDLIGIDKEGKILDFDSYKAAYKEASESKKEFLINLFYLDFLRIGNNIELVMSYTVLEPNWENVTEVKEYEYKKECPIGCEKLFELPIRKIHKPIKFKKFDQNFVVFYLNDYE